MVSIRWKRSLFVVMKQDECRIYKLKEASLKQFNVVWCMWQLSGLIARDFHCFLAV